ncbi:MAG: LysR family transcriptional regulator [Oscillospiraceae bacterium]|nr:LysR family transcriptional regulator [Oscillospiraceae bacterium]MBP5240049.1 LysR family transcriptional regulator [Oscillospiraceae bacterium]
MTLNQLRYFCTAARCHSITQAAKLMFVTQPAVSSAIRELEKEFSVSLFSYTNNRLELTVEGEQLFERAASLLDASDELQLQFQDASRRKPTVRLGTPPNLSAVFFPELLDSFRAEHPEIFLELSEYGSMRACDMVQNERLDLGLVNMELYTVDKFSNLVLATDRLLFCVAENHRFANEEVLDLRRLDHEPVILFNRDSVQNQILLQNFHAMGIKPRVVMHSSQITTTRKFVLQGRCGCFFFSSMLPLVPDLRGIPIIPEIPTRIGLIWKKGKYISAHTRTFIRFCESYYREHPMS